jgi:hypothetical protein
MLTCENVLIVLKELMMRSFTWGDHFLGWAKTSRMVPCKDVLVGRNEASPPSGKT